MNNLLRSVTIALAVSIVADSARAAEPLLLVVLKDEQALALVDVSSGKTVGKVRAGMSPHEVVASSDGQLAFVSNNDPAAAMNCRSITVIDLRQQREARSIDVGPGSCPHGLAFVSGKLFFTAEGYKLVGRYDPATSRIDWLLGTGQDLMHMLAITPDASQMFTANIRSDTVSHLRRSAASSDWSQTHIPVGDGPEGIAVTPDGREVWCANRRDGSISIIDTATSRLSASLPSLGKTPTRMTFTLDGRTALVTDLATGELIVMDTASRSETKRLNLGKSATSVVVSSGGERAYVAVQSADYVAVVDLRRMEVVSKIVVGPKPDGLAWAVRP